MASESPTLTADESEDSTDRIAASIETPEKETRKYTVSLAKLEQLKKAREKAALAAKARAKNPMPVPVSLKPAEPRFSAEDLKAEVAAAVAQAMQASEPKTKAVKKVANAPRTVAEPAKPPLPPKPSREELLMRIIRGY